MVVGPFETAQQSIPDPQQAVKQQVSPVTQPAAGQVGCMQLPALQ